MNMVIFPEKKFPERAEFIRTAHKKTKKAELCTVDRAHAKERAKEVFQSLPPKKGYDQVAYPMTICKESAREAYVGYVKSEDNRKAEEWLRKELKKYPDGTDVMIHLGEPPKIKERHIHPLNENQNKTGKGETEKLK
ncbi:sporulation protein [Salinithrix halophila]|uniref:Sporulation protein n=2 Tax=Salinithrix halophila TaxID=1485204 RepID=A0ABV8JI94_9BACL